MGRRRRPRQRRGPLGPTRRHRQPLGDRLGQRRGHLLQVPHAVPPGRAPRGPRPRGAHAGGQVRRARRAAVPRLQLPRDAGPARCAGGGPCCAEDRLPQREAAMGCRRRPLARSLARDYPRGGRGRRRGLRRRAPARAPRALRRARRQHQASSGEGREIARDDPRWPEIRREHQAHREGPGGQGGRRRRRAARGDARHRRGRGPHAGLHARAAPARRHERRPAAAALAVWPAAGCLGPAG
mmetsp:Transcript_41259/g.133823  ORF Transcript_41259/g.133823 Transcript_41259/m.133823 type:complete len:240 (+) Transcript_41259:396-1115(+)